MEAEKTTEAIIGSAMEVHRNLGPGLLEGVYQSCLAQEMLLRGLSFEREVALPVRYKGIDLDCGYRMDFMVEKTVVVELKTVDLIQPVHEAQLLTYLKLTGCKVGLIINFNVPLLSKGIKRMVL
jgi:GxxExxY protein